MELLTDQIKISDKRIAYMGYTTQRAASIWFYDANYTHRNTNAKLFVDQVAEIPLENGVYEVMWFDTYGNGEIFREEKIVSNGGLLLDFPPWDRDIAVNIVQH